MSGGGFRHSRFWQIWAIVGMLVLTASFWWSMEGLALFQFHRPSDQIADGFLRFSLLFLTPALLITWLAAAWLRRRLGDGGYWQFLAVVAALWGALIIIIRIVIL